MVIAVAFRSKYPTPSAFCRRVREAPANNTVENWGQNIRDREMRSGNRRVVRANI